MKLLQEMVNLLIQREEQHMLQVSVKMLKYGQLTILCTIIDTKYQSWDLELEVVNMAAQNLQ